MEELRQTVWTTGDLLERISRRATFFVLDVRNRDEFERFRFEGRAPLPAVNVPYFEILESGGKDVESLPKFIPEYVDIKRVNAGLLAPTEDDASTLELGKNVCALSQACERSSGETE